MINEVKCMKILIRIIGIAITIAAALYAAGILSNCEEINIKEKGSYAQNISGEVETL